MQNLELKHLRMVLSIAETGNMTRAAEKLCLSQSALSQQLKDIETRLGADLFFRARKKMILTPIGKNLLATAGRVVRLVEEAELEIARVISGEQGELKVGVQCLFCYKWLPEAIRSFQSSFPNVELVIGMAEDLAEDLEGGRFDLVVTAAPAVEERFRYAPLFADQMVCVLPPDHPLSGQDYVRMEDFSRFNLISHAERGRNRFYQTVLKPRGVEPKRFLAVAAPQAMVEMVAAGLGVGIFPAWAVALESGRIISRPLTARGLPLTWHAVSLPNERVVLFQEEFIRIVGRMKVESGGIACSCGETAA